MAASMGGWDLRIARRPSQSPKRYPNINLIAQDITQGKRPGTLICECWAKISGLEAA